MENNTQPVTAQELSNVAMHPRTGFPSEEAMKAYYLQLIDIMNIAYVKESSEYISLQCLKRKLRQFIHVLQLLGTHEWGNGIAEIQDASGFYMLQSTLRTRRCCKPTGKSVCICNSLRNWQAM